jgi:hypothetical protein
VSQDLFPREACVGCGPAKERFLKLAALHTKQINTDILKATVVLFTDNIDNNQ